MGRRPCCEKVGLHRGGWSALEDEVLTNYIKANGEGKWRDLPKKAGLKRCGKSCRLRWLNYLNPKIIRGNITPEEEELIITMHKHFGNSWSLIARRLPGRTDNEIKNYWNTILGKKVHGIHVVPKRKRRKRTDEKESNSNSSVPRRRAAVIPNPIPSAVITPQQPVPPQHSSSTELICETMKNPVHEEFYPTEQLAPSLDNSTDFIGDILENIAIIQSPGQLVSSPENQTVFMGDVVQNIANIEASQSHVYEECYNPQQSGSSQESNTEFMGEVMQDIINFKFASEEYSMYTCPYIFPEFTFTLDESMSEDYWMANTYTDHNSTFDLGSLAVLFETD